MRLSDIHIFTLKREHKLGTRLIDESGQTFKYVKIDFGPLYKDLKTKKTYRHIEYGWLRVRI